MNIIIGTRGSALALAQVKIVEERIKVFDKNVNIQKKIIKTKGDILLKKNLDSVVEKGFFVNEIQQELMNENIDIAVHSLKDLPTHTNDKLQIIAFVKRGAANDCLVINNNISKLENISTIGTSSKRRQYQIKKILPNAVIKSVRGNIDTRIKKLNENKFDALILAKAGIDRLKINDCKVKILDESNMIPAVGQGTIAVEAKSTNPKINFINKALNDKSTQICSQIERNFLRMLNAGCNAPVAAYCRIIQRKINFKAMIFSEKKKIHYSHFINADIKNYSGLAKKMFDYFNNSKRIEILDD